MKKTFPAQSSSLCDLRAAVGEVARRFRLPADDLQDLLVAVTEAGANVVRHTTSPTIEMSARVVLDALSISIHDQGVFRWGIRPQRAWASPSCGA